MQPRKLHLTNFDDLVTEAHRLAQHPDAPSCGTWTPAQNLWHVARLIKASVDGFPANPPLLFRLLGPLLKPSALKKGFNPGIKQPTEMAKHFTPAPGTTIDEAMDMLESSIAKGRAQGFIPASPLFGRLSAPQWEQLHCRHAELHFGQILLPA